MKRISIFGVLVILLVLAGCSALEPNVAEYQPTISLMPNEGYVLFGAASTNPELKFEFSSGLKSYVTPAYPSGLQHRLMVFPEGEYQLSSLYAGAAQFLPSKASRWEGWDFVVQPGKINYFGIISLNGNNFGRIGSLDSANVVVKTNYPDLYGKIEIVDATK